MCPRFQRLTGNKKYTDKLKFTFEDAPSGTCNIHGCSESQVFSVADFSTNYCNLRMLYCGSHENCKSVKKNFAITETSVSPSWGASKNAADCLKTVSEKFLSPPPFVPPFQCPPAGFETATGRKTSEIRSCCFGMCRRSSLFMLSCVSY